MGKRGPKPAGRKLKVIKQAKPRRPNPKPGMSKNSRRIWLYIVKAYPVDHFKPQHHELLRMYCDACAMHKKASKKIEETGEIIKQPNGIVKQNPYIGICRNAESSAAMLATKLGITVNNTTVNRGITGSVTKPKSKREGLIFRG
jgi:phage terminase small subunit